MRFPEINLNHPAHYFTFGPFSVSAGNLAIIAFMVIIFLLALILPFPDHHEIGSGESQNSDSASRSMNNRERGEV